MVLMVDYSSTKGHVGLSIVQQILLEGESNNIVVKYGLSSLTRTPIISSSIALSLSLSSSLSIESDITSVKSTRGGGGVEDDNSCFLKSCHLCKRPLQFDKDIYMYRGDQGFCSIECRNKQIIVDERKEIMEARKYKRSKIAISQIDCRGCETCKLLQDLRQRNHHRTKQPPPSLPPPILSIS